MVGAFRAGSKVFVTPCRPAPQARCSAIMDAMASSAFSNRCCDAALERLDPRAKIVLLVGYSVAVIAASAPWGLAMLAALLAVAMAAGRVSVRSVLAMGAVPYVLVASIAVLNGVRGLDGLVAGLVVGARMLLLLWASCLMMRTSTSTQLQQGLAGLMAPLRRFGVPVDDAALTLSLALRLIPEVSASFRTVAGAQWSRCAALDAGGPMRRARAWGAVFAPVLARLFRRADGLGVALEARGYGLRQPDGRLCRRTELDALTWGARDTAWLVLGLGAFAFCILAL